MDILTTCSTRRTDAQFAAEYGTQFHRQFQSRYVGILLRIQEKYVNNIKPGIYPPNPPMPLVAPPTPHGNDSGKPSRCEQSTQTEPISQNDPDISPDFTSGSRPDCEIVSKSVSEVDSEPEDQEEWPVDAVTDIFAGLYLPSSKLDAAYGPMSEEMN